MSAATHPGSRRLQRRKVECPYGSRKPCLFRFRIYREAVTQNSPGLQPGFSPGFSPGFIAKRTRPERTTDASTPYLQSVRALYHGEVRPTSAALSGRVNRLLT